MKMTTRETVIAAALTPPVAGGIAVVQVVGHDAPAIVAPLLKTRSPLDLQSDAPRRLRLARFVDRGEEIDEAIVAWRREDTGVWVIDLSLHGGQRVVQRVLLALAHVGARIVPGMELLDSSWPVDNPVQREALPLLLRARTTAVAHWLLQAVERLPTAIEVLLAELQADRLPIVRDTLNDWCRQTVQVRHLLDGWRAVLVGEPNAGKSTLANLLAGREASIVSEIPGTTRDWLEHAGAVDGVPFTFVDTAGIRVTDDPLEREAIQRSSAQIAAADVVIHVIDGSLPPSAGLIETLRGTGESTPPPRGQHRIWVWNKEDFPLSPDHRELIRRAGQAGVRLSARTGEHVDQLRDLLIASCGLTGWREALSAPFADVHQQAITEALEALQRQPPDLSLAQDWLKSVIFRPPGGKTRTEPAII